MSDGEVYRMRDTVRSLEKRVTQLETERDEARRLVRLSEHENATCTLLASKLVEAEKERDYFRSKWHDAERAWVSLEQETKRIEAERDKLRKALEACRSFLTDPEGFAEVSISDTVWVREGMTLFDLVEGALYFKDERPVLTPEEAAKLRAEGDEIRRALEQRTAPMKRGPFKP